MLYIDDLRISDSGDYECILTNKDDARDIRHSVYHLQVSPTKGQLKFVDASNDIELEEGGTIRLYHIARSFPDDEYDSEWRKMDEVDIHISEVQNINATYNTIKPDPSLTENSDIYEKDRLELICILPLNDEL
ncbi:unnamed protein product [Gongylonema pulchrum]|uniref:Ig-like domain-containing protein n=1 Tax=Gongylonema pulchrum TaxID=637853 RepID=A0A183EQ51_9BILA|nr:unnamed protein product [Gongylonema pulchrum]